MDNRVCKNLILKLSNIKKEDLSKIKVVLLPDFFLDHTLHIDDIDKMIDDIKRVYKQGGGNIPGIRQDIHSGGNAANTALALARLGVKTYLISKTDETGAELIRFYLESAGVDISHIRTDGRLSVTTALEFGSKHINVMIGDPGSVESFSYDVLDDHDLALISESDLVGVMNWNLNRYGTDLAKKIFNYAKKHDTMTFFDSGDPSPKKNEIQRLKEEVLKDDTIDIFSMNENELRYYTGEVSILSKDEMIKAAIKLKREIKPRIDLHTTLFTSSIDDIETVTVPAYELDSIKRSTGAGDNWNAGDILGELIGLETEERLLCANTVAACYITSRDPLPPTLEEVIGYLKKTM
ncbi:MAG: carbohydrate kinase family protein [Candidatus Thermoplasmatota archaeon]